MSYSVLISEILRTKNLEALSRVNNTPRSYLNEIEKKSLDYINNHIQTYKEFPSPDAFVNEGYISIYREDYKGDALDYLYEKFIGSTREYHAKKLLNDIELSLASGKDIDEKLFIERINNLPRVNIENPRNLSDYIDDSLFVGMDISKGFELGFKEIDGEIGCVRKGQCVGLIAHPANGKTTFLTVLAVKAFIEGKKVAYFTFEQPRSEIIQNVLACIGKFNTRLYNAPIGSADSMLLQDKKELAKHRVNLYESRGGKLDVIEAQTYTIERIKNVLKKEEELTGDPFDVIFFDNGVYLMRHESLAGWQKYEANMQEIKALAMGDKDLGIRATSVFFSSQFDSKTGGESAADISKTKTIFESADILIGIQLDTSSAPDGRVLKLMKNRSRGRTHGVAQVVKINYGETMITQANGLSSYTPVFEIGGFGLITIEENDDEENTEDE